MPTTRVNPGRRRTRRLAIAAIIVASISVVLSGVTMWRIRDVSSSSSPSQTTTTGHASVVVPYVGGRFSIDAAAQLASVQLGHKVTKVPSASANADTVISQNPAGGVRVAPRSVVQLTVSAGPP